MLVHFIQMQGRGSGNVVEEFCAESSLDRKDISSCEGMTYLSIRLFRFLKNISK